MKDSKSETTQLVKKGDLAVYLQEQTDKQKLKISDLEKIIPLVSSDMQKTLNRNLTRAKEVVTALEAGFIPVDGGWFMNPEKPNRWNKKWLKEIVDSMPEEVRSAWERVQKMDIFDSFGVQGARQGDPMLIGRKGGKRFLIASWINFEGGHAIGFIVRAAQ